MDAIERVQRPTLAEVHAFLLGTGPIHGMWFGDGDSARPYWWRKYLREALAQPKVDEQEVREVVERLRAEAKEADRMTAAVVGMARSAGVADAPDGIVVSTSGRIMRQAADLLYRLTGVKE